MVSRTKAVPHAEPPSLPLRYCLYNGEVISLVFLKYVFKSFFILAICNIGILHYKTILVNPDSQYRAPLLSECTCVRSFFTLLFSLSFSHMTSGWRPQNRTGYIVARKHWKRTDHRSLGNGENFFLVDVLLSFTMCLGIIVLVQTKERNGVTSHCRCCPGFLLHLLQNWDHHEKSLVVTWGDGGWRSLWFFLLFLVLLSWLELHWSHWVSQGESERRKVSWDTRAPKFPPLY